MDVVRAFVGAFAALVVMAEISIANRWVKYIVALLVGALVSVVLAWVLEWMVRALKLAT